MMDQNILPPSFALRRLVNGYQVTQAIHVAAKLGLADHLVDGPRASDDLVRVTISRNAFGTPWCSALGQPLPSTTR